MNSPAVTVNLPDGRAYPVHIGTGVMARAKDFPPARVAVVSNATVFPLYGDALLSILRDGGKEAFTVLVEDGEQHKNLRSLENILDAMVEREIGRDGGVVALGGGVVGDLAGFAAAVYMRGIPVLQLPTTLLAQADAAIGGKTGVNHARGKNLIGAFHQPRAVLCDTATLSSLPPREYRAGLAEIVKYGLINDADFFQWLENNADALVAGDAKAVEYALRVSVRAKANIVGGDERENNGGRALLNLGHTFAHALEATRGYGDWLHGEAVAFGLVAAARLSESVNRFAEKDTARLTRLLTAMNLPVALPPQSDAEELLAAMRLDKKNLGGGKRFVLMRAIGDAYLDFVKDAPVRRALAAR